MICRIKPRQKIDKMSESFRATHIKEESERSTLGGLSVARDEAGEGNYHSNHLAGGADKEHLATTQGLDEEERGESGEGVDGRED